MAETSPNVAETPPNAAETLPNTPKPEQRGTHHGFHVLGSEGGQLQLQLAQALEALQEILEKGSGLVHQQQGEAGWRREKKKVVLGPSASSPLVSPQGERKRGQERSENVFF